MDERAQGVVRAAKERRQGTDSVLSDVMAGLVNLSRVVALTAEKRMHLGEPAVFAAVHDNLENGLSGFRVIFMCNKAGGVFAAVTDHGTVCPTCNHWNGVRPFGSDSEGSVSQVLDWFANRLSYYVMKEFLET